MRTISVDELTPGMELASNVYGPVDKRLLIAPTGTRLTNGTIAMLRDHRVNTVEIRSDKGMPDPPTQTFVAVSDFVELPAPKPSMDETLRKEAIDSIEQLFDSAASVEEVNLTTAYHAVRQIGQVVGQLVDTLSQDSIALVNISDLKSYDEYTYHHSLSVAVLSIAIGQSFGLSKDMLNRIGRCAMVHDIGKTAIPIEIINKPGRLTAEEFELVKQHSLLGYRFLAAGDMLEQEALKGVLHHHEKHDGTGYPHGLSGKDIPFLARILSVADVYDALTSYRSYRKPMQPGEATEYLMANIGKAFDYDVVNAFLLKLEPYPAGHFVELSDGRTAVVLGGGHPMRPVVRDVVTGDVLDLLGDRRLLNLTISTLLSNVVVQ